MTNEIHLKNPVSGGTFCGLEGHEVYTRKDRELAGMKRLAEVNCKACLANAMEYFQKQSLKMMRVYDEIKVCAKLNR